MLECIDSSQLKYSTDEKKEMHRLKQAGLPLKERNMFALHSLENHTSQELAKCCHS